MSEQGKIKTEDFLLEIGVEELPAKGLHDLIAQLAFNVEKELQSAELSYVKVNAYVSGRRLAVYINQLAGKQKDQVLEKRGPLLSAAFNEDGSPTAACLGFANSCGALVSELETYKTSTGSWVLYKKLQPGKTVFELMPNIISEAVKNLSFAKSMRWSDDNIFFIRPVRWVLMLYSKEVIKAEILGVTADRKTYGHRFHHPEAISIPDATQYTKILFDQGKVIVDFEQRKELIRHELAELAKNIGTVIVDEDLLEEVTGMVEWPKAILCSFDEKFLNMPFEALIAVMKNQQRCFYLVNETGGLLPCFITISNIESKDPEVIVKGNERVMRSRLSDIQFFYQLDLKASLESYCLRLKGVVYHSGLGNLYDKALRLKELSAFIAKKLNIDVNASERAAFLAKADLMTNMVKELPELQGVMGYYYALQQNELEIVAVAIKEHYLPKFSGDILSGNDIALVVALADRIDNLVGIFGIEQIPTGDKDPFGLRRSSLAIIRIIIEKQYALDLKELLQFAANNYKDAVFKKSVVKEILDFIFERLRGFYLEQNIPATVFNSVLAKSPSSLLDFKRRVEAVLYFKTLPQAAVLIAANKRVNNILKKIGILPKEKFDATLFTEDAERELASELLEAKKIVAPLFNEGFYTEALKVLTELKSAIDNFFDKVLVMDENEKLRNNRLALLNELHALFGSIADISML